MESKLDEETLTVNVDCELAVQNQNRGCMEEQIQVQKKRENHMALSAIGMGRWSRNSARAGDNINVVHAKSPPKGGDQGGGTTISGSKKT